MSRDARTDLPAAGRPPAIENDPLWKVECYRIAVHAMEVGWDDLRAVGRFRPLKPLSGQLYRAVCSIAANIAEGYSRGTGRDRARFYEYALGSAREAVVWYHAVRHALPAELHGDRLARLERLRRLLLTMIQDQRQLGRAAGVNPRS